MSGRPPLLRPATALFSVATLSLSPVAWGAQAGSAPPGEPTSTEEVQASPDVQPQVEMTTEKEEPVASPDVQSQMGLGTEKEEGPATTPAPSDTEGEPKDTNDPNHPHGFQFGLKAGYVYNYRMMFRSEDSPFCEPPNTSEPRSEAKKVCGFSGPPALDFALSFAIFDGLEPFAFFRMGLEEETETATDKLKVLGVGARLYTSSDSPFKLFIEPAIGMQTEKGIDDPAHRYPEPGEDFVAEYKQDLFFHLGMGPQFDFSRYAGVYANVALNASVIRALNTSFEIQGGLQLRAP